MSRDSIGGMTLGLAVMACTILTLNAVLQPGDSGKGMILAGCIWAYLLFFWRPWQRPGSHHKRDLRGPGAQ